MHKLEQGSDEWLEFRRMRIMASEAPIIMGASPWSTPLELYWNKIEGTRPEKNAAMKYGTELEPEARARFEDMVGAKVETGVITHPEFEWMGASLDGYNEKEGILVEIKCPNEMDHHLASCGQIPPKYYAQLQHQMYVCQMLMMYYFSYRPKDDNPCALVLVDRDGVYLTELLKKEKEFYDCLINREPPDPLPRDIKKHQKIVEMQFT